MTTNDSKRLATLKSLIDIGKSQGYVVRAEAAAMLSAELLNEEQVADVLATIDDMGIFVVDDPPTAKELAAMKTPSVSATPTPAVAPPALGPAIGAPIVVLKVGAEGGEIRLIAQELATGWRYRYSMFDQSDLWLDEGGGEFSRQSEWVYEWGDALASVDKYPWAILRPMEVHPQFAARVFEAARERLTRDESSPRARSRLAEWSDLCVESEMGLPDPVNTAIHASIAEMHVDFLLWEELQSNDNFLRRFIEHCVGENDFVRLSGLIERSVSNWRGESDLLLVYLNKADKRVAILIEDKIGAALQPRQAARYRERGQDGIPSSWDSFITCLVAPERYLSGLHGFDVSLSLQAISGWLDCGGDDRRAAFKRAVLDAAINKEQIIGPKVIDEAVTKFRECYYALLRSEYPDLQMNPPKPSYAGETWFRIKHPALPPGAWLHHKPDRGYMDLSFPDLNVKAFWPIRDLLEPGQTVVQTGKSASLRVQVPSVGSFADFSPQAGNVRKGLDAAIGLMRLYSREQRAFEQVLESR